MKPHEFWNCTYREAYTFVEANKKYAELNYKKEIVLTDSLGDKIITGLTGIKPKRISLVRNIFKDLFKEELSPKQQTIEEQIKILRGMK